MLLKENIENYSEDFYDNIKLPNDLEEKYKNLLSTKTKKIFKMSFHLKDTLAKHLLLEDNRIYYGKFGKPYLQKKNTKIEFSISHHDDYVVLYYNDNKPVGIDILNTDKVKNSYFTSPYFSPEEKDFSITKENFCKIWMVKEAYGKLLGCGLQREISNINLLPFIGKIYKDIQIRIEFFENFTLCICEKIIN